MRRIVLSSVVLLLALASMDAQSWSTGPSAGDEGNTHNSWVFGHADRACELRHTSLPLVGEQLAVKGTNGGIEADRRSR